MLYKMKCIKVVFVSICIFIGFNVSFAQTLDSVIRAAATDVSRTIEKKGKLKIAIADFVNNAGNSDAVTKYITDQFEINLINANEKIQVMNRRFIKKLLSDNKLQSQGLIDESTAKSSVEFIKVDGWAFGEVYSFGDYLKISIKVIDASTSLTYVAYSSPSIRNDIEQKMNPITEKQIASRIDELNENANSDCIEKNTGDLVFSNKCVKAVKYNNACVITLFGPTKNRHEISVNANQEGTFYNLPVGVYEYYIKYNYIGGYGLDRLPIIFTELGKKMPVFQPNFMGQIKVDKCRTNKHDINW